MSLTGDGAVVKEVKSMEFLGAPPANDTTCSMVKKAQQYHHALRRPKSTSLPTPVLTTFCTGTILTWGLIPWFGSCKAALQCQLNRTVKTARRITVFTNLLPSGVLLPKPATLSPQGAVESSAALIH